MSNISEVNAADFLKNVFGDAKWKLSSPYLVLDSASDSISLYTWLDGAEPSQISDVIQFIKIGVLDDKLIDGIVDITSVNLSVGPIKGRGGILISNNNPVAHLELKKSQSKYSFPRAILELRNTS